MGQITRTCSLFALAALALAPQVAQAQRKPAVSALGRYVQARIADTAGADTRALQSYSAALTADPTSPAIALRAYRGAIEAGDKLLALRALRALQPINAVPVDGHLLLLSESLNKSDWRGAEQQLDKLDEAVTFSFLTPVLRAWTMVGSKTGQPIGALSAKSNDGLSVGYAQEHRGLILLAQGSVEEGVAALGAQRGAGLTGSPNLQLRLAAAQRLLDLKRRDAALALLNGEQALLGLAREEATAGRPIARSIARPSTGMAMLLSRVANDLIRDNASPVALTLARLASFADPNLPVSNLVLARALSVNGNAAGGIALLDRLPKDKVTASLGAEQRFDLLVSAQRYDEAQAMARAQADLPGSTAADQAQLGEVLSRMERHSEAAASYAKAIELMAGPDKSNVVPWNMWLLLGREYDLAKDWARARPALERAAALGPDEPTALNHLGYAMLVNGGSIGEATRYIEKASKLRPNDAAIADSLGWALFKGGRIAEAIPVLERAAQAEPTVAEIGEHLGDAYWAAGRKVEARYAWRAAQVQAEEADATRLAAKIEFGPGARP